MPWAMTSFEVKLSVVPGWKWRGHTMADCFVLSENADTDMVASLGAAACFDVGLMIEGICKLVCR